MADADTSSALELTLFLQVCCCAVQRVEQGDVCSVCSCLGQWEGDHNNVCEADYCEASKHAALTDCIGCNVSWHTSCHLAAEGCDMRCGLQRDGKPGAWCNDCFKQVVESGALDIVRRCTDASSSFSTSKRQAEPPSSLRPAKARRPKKTQRVLHKKSMPVELTPCTDKHKWTHCGGCQGHTGLECARVTEEDRLRHRAQFERVRNDSQPGALHRAMSLVYSGMRWRRWRT